LAITITRRQALQLRAVLRRAFGTRGTGPGVGFTADAEGLRVRAMSADAAVEYHVPGARPAETLWLPFAFLGDCEGKKDEPVHIEATGKGRVTAQWRDGSVPQIVRYDSDPPADADKFPALPKNFAENPPGLLEAVTAAGDTTDPDAVRYATHCIQLRHDGTINATDGRQMLVQSGFTFPWDNAVLIPRSKVFSSPELPHDGPVTVAKSGDWVVIRVGPWTFFLGINKDGRFPDLSRHIARPADATASCRLSPADAEFLGETLPRLPCDEEFNFPITVDLNGSVAIRARAADQPRPTELVLTGSEWSGAPIRVNTNRKYLARAAKLGFHELFFYGDKAPVLCRDDCRQFVWALLDPESAIRPADDAIRIVSPASEPQSPVTRPQTRRRVSPVPEPTTSSNGNAAAATVSGNGQSNGHAKANGQAKLNGEARNGTARKPGQDVESMIRQAEKLRTSAHDLMHEAGVLVKALKQHRRQSRAVQNTLASLRQLRTLGV